MSIPSIFTILQTIGYLADSIFIGLKFIVPVIFLLVIFKVKSGKVNFVSLVLAANLLLLIGGILFLLTIISNTLHAWFSENEFEREMIISMITGPNWFQIVIPVFTYGLLPQTMWIGKLRSTIYSSFIIVMLWFGSYFLVDYLSHGSININFPSSEYSKKAVLFIALLTVFYFIILKSRGWKDKQAKAKS